MLIKCYNYKNHYFCEYKWYKLIGCSHSIKYLIINNNIDIVGKEMLFILAFASLIAMNFVFAPILYVGSFAIWNIIVVFIIDVAFFSALLKLYLYP